MTITGICIIVLCSVTISTGLLVLGAVIAAWLIGKGMVSVGNAPLLGSNKGGDAFSILDGSELSMPEMPAGDEKNIKQMAADVLRSFGSPGGG